MSPSEPQPSRANSENKLGIKIQGSMSPMGNGKELGIFRSTRIDHNCLDNLGRNGVSFYLTSPGNFGHELWCALVDTDCQ